MLTNLIILAATFAAGAACWAKWGATWTVKTTEFLARFRKS
jgi:hypothetical protein